MAMRVCSAPRFFRKAHLEVLFALVAMLSSLCHHDSPGPLRYHLFSLWACCLNDGLD